MKVLQIRHFNRFKREKTITNGFSCSIQKYVINRDNDLWHIFLVSQLPIYGNRKEKRNNHN